MRRVFILGAGFSRAINHHMPLLDDLSRGIQSTLRSKGIDIASDLKALGNVERWLALLAEPAPWLPLSEQRQSFALFTEVSQAIHDVLTAMQVRASIVSPPAWLLPLVKYWDRARATVITFNYDCLVELAYEELTSTTINIGLASNLYGIPITPAALRTSAVLDYDRAETFRLHKLHGSLNWWYSGPESGQFDAIYELRWTGKFGSGMAPLWLDQDDLVSDKYPMLVPPVATKAPFYKNRLLATQWIKAGEALHQAEELVLMGYSAPLTDLTVATLIATQFKGRAIVPVDVDPTIVNRLKELRSKVNPPDVDDSFIGVDPIDKWTKMCAF